MIPKGNLLIHETVSCTARVIKKVDDEAPPTNSESREETRKRRKQERHAACVAQARAMGMVEEGGKCDFARETYAAAAAVIAPPSPRSSPEGNIYNNNTNMCLDDYKAAAHAAGRIEDGFFDHDPAQDSHLSTAPITTSELQDYSALARAIGMVEEGSGEEEEDTLSTVSTDSSTGVGSSNSTSSINDYAASARAAGMIEDGASVEDLPPAATVSPLISSFYKLSATASPLASAFCKIGSGVFVGCLFGGAQSMLQGRSVVDGLLEQGAASVVGCGLMVGTVALSTATTVQH